MIKNGQSSIMCIFMIICMTALTGCGNVAEDNEPPITKQEPSAESENPGEVIENVQSAEEQAPAELIENPEPIETAEKVEYSHEDIYLSLEIPNGWDYKIKTAEEMEKYDGMTICAVEFWKEDYPGTVFTLSYESLFGICGTGVTIEEFTKESGISGYRYTEEIEDTLWLTMTFRNPEDDVEEGGSKGGTYCLMASPKLSEWDVIEPEFEEIVESIWVGSH